MAGVAQSGGTFRSADLDPRATEIALQQLVTVYVVVGLLFLLLPGTFLGVWNLISISGLHSQNGPSQSWLQAHGHAQIFGWIGTFIIGIGDYSLSKMGRSGRFAVSRAWVTWGMWTAGALLLWATNLWEWHWRGMLPLSAMLELGGLSRLCPVGQWPSLGKGACARQRSGAPHLDAFSDRRNARLPAEPVG